MTYVVTRHLYEENNFNMLPSFIIQIKPAGASFVALVPSYPFSLFSTARDGKQGGGDCRAGRGLGREQAALVESVSWR